MNYEYKDEILEHIGPEPNCNYQSERDKHYEMLKELDEVYQKAQAYDDLKFDLENNIDDWNESSNGKPMPVTYQVYQQILNGMIKDESEDE